jgi:hypothetical protein
MYVWFYECIMDEGRMAMKMVTITTKKKRED